jgi:hypothetical protein
MARVRAAVKGHEARANVFGSTSRAKPRSVDVE